MPKVTRRGLSATTDHKASLHSKLCVHQKVHKPDQGGKEGVRPSLHPQAPI